MYAVGQMKEWNQKEENMSDEVFDRMDETVSRRGVVEFTTGAMRIISSLREAGFEDQDIKEYLAYFYDEVFKI